MRSSILLWIIALSLRLVAQVEPPGGNLPAQPIGAGDLLAISVYGAPELTRTVRVSPEGSIRLPLLFEKIAALGRMPVEVETMIAGALAKEQILVDPAVTVTSA